MTDLVVTADVMAAVVNTITDHADLSIGWSALTVRFCSSSNGALTVAPCSAVRGFAVASQSHQSEANWPPRTRVYHHGRDGKGRFGADYDGFRDD